MKTSKTSHVRELTDLELQAVEGAFNESDADLVFSLGTETGGGKTVPFVAIQRKDGDEVVVRFFDKHKTAEARRSEEGRTPPAKKPPAITTGSGSKKPAARK